MINNYITLQTLLNTQKSLDTNEFSNKAKDTLTEISISRVKNLTPRKKIIVSCC